MLWLQAQCKRVVGAGLQRLQLFGLAVVETCKLRLRLLWKLRLCKHILGLLLEAGVHLVLDGVSKHVHLLVLGLLELGLVAGSHVVLGLLHLQRPVQVQQVCIQSLLLAHLLLFERQLEGRLEVGVVFVLRVSVLFLFRRQSQHFERTLQVVVVRVVIAGGVSASAVAPAGRIVVGVAVPTEAPTGGFGRQAALVAEALVVAQKQHELLGLDPDDGALVVVHLVKMDKFSQRLDDIEVVAGPHDTFFRAKPNQVVQNRQGLRHVAPVLALIVQSAIQHVHHLQKLRLGPVTAKGDFLHIEGCGAGGVVGGCISDRLLRRRVAVGDVFDAAYEGL